MVRARRAESSRIGAAFAPAHVTGLFVPQVSARDPRARGSIGAGMVLDMGVRARARWLPHKPQRMVIRADVPGPLPITEEVTRRLWAGKGGRLEIELVHELPISQGFGMSAAGALATALSVGYALGVPRQQCIQIAHLADLFHAGGLGGVAAILGGGLEMRLSPGVPPWGEVRHRPVTMPVFLGAMGLPLPSRNLLSRPLFLERIRSVGTPGLDRLFRHPGLERFFRESAGFGDALDLAPPSLTNFLHELRGKKIPCIQAMFGRSFLAIPRSRSAREYLLNALERRGWRALELGPASQGSSARLLDVR